MTFPRPPRPSGRTALWAVPVAALAAVALVVGALAATGNLPGAGDATTTSAAADGATGAGGSGATPSASPSATASGTVPPAPAGIPMQTVSPSSTERAAGPPQGYAEGAGPDAARPASRWRPRAGQSWHWQLSGKIDTSVDADVFDVDLFETSAATVADLKSRGRKVICYVNVGATEDYRPDAKRFPAAVQGKGNGWEGEKWLDIRRLDVLEPIMASRFDLCRSKGFDAVEPDLVEAYTNDSGFPVTGAQQLAYNKLLAKLAHDRGLAIGLKNDLEQIPQLVSTFDFAVSEQCFEFDECGPLRAFVQAGRPVFHVEYDLETSQFCAEARAAGFSSQRKHLELDAWREVC